jgi:hypothetical protein
MSRRSWNWETRLQVGFGLEKLKGAQINTKVEMKRFTVISSKPFDEVVAALKAAIGHPNMVEFWQSIQAATSEAELEAAVQPVLGETGLMQFVEFDQGMVVLKGTTHHSSQSFVSSLEIPSS